MKYRDLKFKKKNMYKLNESWYSYINISEKYSKMY